MEVSGQFHAPTTLSLGKNPGIHLIEGLGGRQSRSGRNDKKK
jgi:hypothetical protein